MNIRLLLILIFSLNILFAKNIKFYKTHNIDEASEYLQNLPLDLKKKSFLFVDDNNNYYLKYLDGTKEDIKRFKDLGFNNVYFEGTKHENTVLTPVKYSKIDEKTLKNSIKGYFDYKKRNLKKYYLTCYKYIKINNGNEVYIPKFCSFFSFPFIANNNKNSIISIGKPDKIKIRKLNSKLSSNSNRKILIDNIIKDPNKIKFKIPSSNVKKSVVDRVNKEKYYSQRKNNSKIQPPIEQSINIDDLPIAKTYKINETPKTVHSDDKITKFINEFKRSIINKDNSSNSHIVQKTKNVDKFRKTTINEHKVNSSNSHIVQKTKNVDKSRKTAINEHKVNSSNSHIVQKTKNVDKSKKTAINEHKVNSIPKKENLTKIKAKNDIVYSSNGKNHLNNSVSNSVYNDNSNGLLNIIFDYKYYVILLLLFILFLLIVIFNKKGKKNYEKKYNDVLGIEEDTINNYDNSNEFNKRSLNIDEQDIQNILHKVKNDK